MKTETKVRPKEKLILRGEAKGPERAASNETAEELDVRAHKTTAVLQRFLDFPIRPRQWQV